MKPCTGHVKKLRRTLSQRACLQFPVARVGRHLRCGFYAPRVGVTASVFLSAVMEYPTAEVLELAGNVTIENKKMRITPRDILLSMQHDEELSEIFESVTIAKGGFVPDIKNYNSPSTTSWNNTM